MANVHITSDYTITNVNFCNTPDNAQTWYQVEYQWAGQPQSLFYVTPYNDEKFPAGLAKDDFISNVLPSLSTHYGIMSTANFDDLSSWDTEE